MRKLLVAVLALSIVPSLVSAQIEMRRDRACCDIDGGHGLVWVGTDTLMSFERFAAHCAPVLWFSPDEPLLAHARKSMDIDIPMAFPFEETNGTPVVYFRVRNIITRHDKGSFVRDTENIENSQLDLSEITGVELDYFFYYPSEEGFGGHVHDVESVEMKVAIVRQPGCSDCRYGIVVTLINAKAHGVLWYDNTLEVDEYTQFPIHLLVEEGKHATCTDKNQDGYYTPGYDVNRRVNDAWGVRDVLRTGALFSGGFQSWFAKVRIPEARVFPPLPDDSWVKARFVDEDGVYAATYPKYELRPFPTVEEAADYDPELIRFVDKGHHDWPETAEDTGVQDIQEWIEEEEFVKSITVAFRMDNEIGMSILFPLFIVKNYNDPISGGWLVNRIILKDQGFRDFAWNVLYTGSASRWLDGYFAAGVEVDDDGMESRTGFMTETGIKFRANIAHSPLGFLKHMTDFWGLRVGVRYVGYKQFTQIGYAVEVGAGSF